MQQHKLSLSTAILININIMLGAGIFINTATLAHRAGFFGAFMYVAVGLLMLPLILCIVQLLKLHPTGGFYAYARNEIGPFMGFLSGWSYFIAKLASCMLMIHVSITLIQHIFPTLSNVHPFILDFFVVCLFSLLNFLNIKASGNIQKMFIGFKTFPIFFAILAGAYLLQADNLIDPFNFSETLFSSLPLVIYAVIGFEAACSISSQIKDPQKNAPLAVLISFGIVIFIATLYQAIFYGALGKELVQCSGHCDTFPALISSLFGETLFAQKFEGLVHLAIASSTLGAAYGIIFSNSWNLHILAQNKHLWGSHVLVKLNRNLIPFACVLIEGVICLIYLAVSQGVLIPLQQIGALGCIIAYTCSVGALLSAIKNNPACTVKPWIPLLGLASCAILMTACVRSFILNGMSSLTVYSLLLGCGVLMFYLTKVREPKSTVPTY